MSFRFTFSCVTQRTHQSHRGKRRPERLRGGFDRGTGVGQSGGSYSGASFGRADRVSDRGMGGRDRRRAGYPLGAGTARIRHRHQHFIHNGIGRSGGYQGCLERIFINSPHFSEIGCMESFFCILHAARRHGFDPAQSIEERGHVRRRSDVHNTSPGLRRPRGHRSRSGPWQD